MQIAPHIVFSDPHLPWERSVYDDESDTDNINPWLALFPFDVNHPTSPELRLTNDQLSAVRVALGQPDLDPGPAFSFSSTVQKFANLPKPTTRTSTPTGTGTTGAQIWIPDYSRDDMYQTSMLTDTTPVELIFLQGGLFKKLFCSKSDPNKPDLRQFRYCAHVRNINTTGMTNAGTNDTGLFSIVHSKRSGPTDVAQGAAPRSQAVHLLSLEYLDSLKSASFQVQDADLICFVSLHRWTYLCQPPLTVNFIDSKRAPNQQASISPAPLEANWQSNEGYRHPDEMESGCNAGRQRKDGFQRPHQGHAPKRVSEMPPKRLVGHREANPRT